MPTKQNGINKIHEINRNAQGPVVRKLISANPELKVNQGFNTLV